MKSPKRLFLASETHLSRLTMNFTGQGNECMCAFLRRAQAQRKPQSARGLTGKKGGPPSATRPSGGLVLTHECALRFGPVTDPRPGLALWDRVHTLSDSRRLSGGKSPRFAPRRPAPGSGSRPVASPPSPLSERAEPHPSGPPRTRRRFAWMGNLYRVLCILSW